MNAEWTQGTIDRPSQDLLDAVEVARLFGISRGTLDGLVNDGEFPKPLSIGKQTRVWDWRAVAYYRLRLEMMPRIDLKPTQTVAKPSQTAGKQSQSEHDVLN